MRIDKSEKEIVGTKADLNENKAPNGKAHDVECFDKSNNKKYVIEVRKIWTIEADKPRSSIPNFYYNIAFVGACIGQKEKKNEIKHKKKQ